MTKCYRNRVTPPRIITAERRDHLAAATERIRKACPRGKRETVETMSSWELTDPDWQVVKHVCLPMGKPARYVWLPEGEAVER